MFFMMKGGSNTWFVPISLIVHPFWKNFPLPWLVSFHLVSFFPPLLSVFFYWWLVSFHHLCLLNIVQFIILVNVSFSPYVWLGFYLFFNLYFNLSYKSQTKVRTIYFKTLS
jgi:hypothetical protein